MSYTFLNQQSKLSSLLGDSNTGTDDQFTSASRLKEINRGELQYAKDTKMLREKASGTISSGQLAFPSDMLDIYVLIVNNYVITKDREISVKDWERWYNYGGNIPLYYISEESGIRYIKFLGTVNGLSYTLYYFKKPTTELADDGDTSLFPEEYREASVYYAAAELLEQVGKNQISDKYRALYSKLVKDGQMYVEKLYIDKEYAVPDTNMLDSGTTDVQGVSFDYA